MLSLRFDSLLASFSATGSSFDFDELSAFFFDASGVSFDASSVGFDAGAAPSNETLRFDTSIRFDTTHERFDEV
jgi:hypothetical protein